MKNSIILALATVACATAFAQAPAGVVPRPSGEANPTASGGAAAAKAEMKTQAKTGAMPLASGMGSTSSTEMGMGMKGMDANGDGMISKKEWQAHHNMMWSKMKTKNGMVPMADIEAMMKAGGPN